MILAERVRAYGHGLPCGRIFSVIEEEYRVVRVEKGQLSAERIAVENPCPLSSAVLPIGQLQRLFLVAKKPSSWPGIPVRSALKDRRYIVRKESLLPELLGKERAEIERLIPLPAAKATEAGWTSYGPDLAVSYQADKVVRIRVVLPAGWPLEEHPSLYRMGWPQAGRPLRSPGNPAEYLWSGRGKQRLAPGVAARLKGHDLEIWREEERVPAP